MTQLNLVNLGSNHSGDSTKRRPRGKKKEGTASFSFLERQQLRNPGQAKLDMAIFLARDAIAERFPRMFRNGDAVAAAIVSGTAGPRLNSLYHALRQQFAE
jgi:hypothetical protein